jgi:endogenous inhibitor of DNA gyrase (YacG/DUF329 family)
MTSLNLSVACPGCRKKVPWQGNPHRPFCSERCRLIDLGAWAEENYRVAGSAVRTEKDDNLIEFPKPD